MALKDLLVYVDQSEESLDGLNLAAELAALHSSHLTALFVAQRTRAQELREKHSELALAPAGDIQALDQHIDAAIKNAAKRLRSALELHGVEKRLATEWIYRDGPATDVVLDLARYFDLTVIAKSAPDGLAERLMLDVARPTIILPDHYIGETLGSHIAIAWNASRAATRAINDALPLIELARRTTILVIDEMGVSEALPLEQIAEHIRRHALAVDIVRTTTRGGQSIAQALQHEARQAGADLLVAGAFGHLKLREDVLGGVTRNLLDGAEIPLFLSY